MCCITFELTPTTEAGGVSLVRDDALSAADQAYAACRSGSAVERGVMQHLGGGRWARLCEGYLGAGDFTSRADRSLLAQVLWKAPRPPVRRDTSSLALDGTWALSQSVPWK
jgi:hypothetical protein